MSDPTAAATATATATAASATATESDPVTVIVGDLKWPGFIIFMVIFAVANIGLLVFLCAYNCCNRAEVRRRYVAYHAPSSPRWVPDVHVPGKFKQARAAEATVYRFA